MVTVWPATVIVPVRCGPLLAATVYPTVLLPFPGVPDVTVIHAALLLAVQPQPGSAVTVIVPGPPAVPTTALNGLTLVTHVVEKDQTPDSVVPASFRAATFQ